MFSEGISSATTGGGEAQAIRNMIQHSSDQANRLVRENIANSKEVQRTLTMQELDGIKYNTERSMANEMANRTLSKMFGSFSLIQKIMQNMG